MFRITAKVKVLTEFVSFLRLVCVRKHGSEFHDAGKDGQEEETDSAKERSRFDRFQNHPGYLLARFHVRLIDRLRTEHESLL